MIRSTRMESVDLLKKSLAAMLVFAFGLGFSALAAVQENPMVAPDTTDTTDSTSDAIVVESPVMLVDDDRQRLAALDFGQGHGIEVSTVELENDELGVEITEGGHVDSSITSVESELDIRLVEIANATSQPSQEIPQALVDRSGPPRLGPQGWLRSELDKSLWSSEDRRLLDDLRLDNGNQLIFLEVEIGDGDVGFEVMERGLPGNPSIASVDALGDRNLVEIFNAVSKPGTRIPQALTDRFGAPALGSQGWLEEQWRSTPEDFPRATCSDSWFTNKFNSARTVGGNYFEKGTLRLNWQGTYYHQVTRGGAGGNGITDYYSIACNQHHMDYQYRIRRKNSSSSSYIDWTISFFDPGEWYYYLWTAPSGLYRFRTEINHGYGSAGNTDIGVCWSDL